MSISDLINIKSKVMRGRQAAPAPGGRRRDGKGKPLTESPVFDVRLVELIIKSTNLYFTIKLRSVYKELHADHETGAADNK